jgi:lysophospholipase L1-like esterase
MRNVFRRHGWMIVAGIVSFAAAARAGDDEGRGKWFSAWTVSTGARMGPAFTGANFAPDPSGSTLRMIVRPTISGTSVRVKIENTLSATPAVFSGVFIGRLDAGAALAAGTNKRLTFGGKNGLTLAPGQGAYSDPVKFDAEAFQRLAVSLDVVSAPEISGHQLGLATNYIAAGAVGSRTSGAGFSAVPDDGGGYPVYFVSAVDVQSNKASGTIVALGDSITDGRCSTRDPLTGAIPADIYNRWSDVLANRLHALHGDRAPVLDRAGIRWVIFFEGTNDITGNATADQVIAGLQQVIDRVHAKGIPIYGIPVVPRGRAAPMTGWTASMEAVKLQVNHWMHTQANFDGIIEFGALLAGPILTETDGIGAESLWPDWACFDFTHPNKFGYPAMGGSIDLTLFSNPPAW